MSIVIITITPDSIIAMSDGRIVDQNHCIIEENFKKIEKINSNICVGYTGNLNFLSNLFMKFYDHIEDTESIMPKEAFKLLYNQAKDIFKNHTYDMDSVIVLCGFDYQNRLFTSGFSTNDFYIQTIDPYETGTAIYVISNYPGCYKIAYDNIQKYGLLGGMRKTIEYISTVDGTVNNRIYIEQIIVDINKE